jgi:hypothetical protein
MNDPNPLREKIDALPRYDIHGGDHVGDLVLALVTQLFDRLGFGEPGR